MLRSIIHRPVAVSMVLVAIAVSGFLALTRLPVSLLPDIGANRFTITVNSPDRSARDLNTVLMSPLVMQLSQMPGLTDLKSVTDDGIGIIEMDFDYGLDSRYLGVDVNERIDKAIGVWPDGEERPIVTRTNASDIPAMFLSISLKNAGENDEMRFAELCSYAENVAVRRLEQLPQVAMADISGLVHSRAIIIPDMEKLASLGMDESYLADVISASSVHMGNLSVSDGGHTLDIRLDSAPESVEDIGKIWLNVNGRLFQIRDLADVRICLQPSSGMVSQDGRRAVSIAVIKQADARMEDLHESLDNLLQTLQTDCPDMEYTITRDQTELLEYSMDNMKSSMILGTLFACIIIFLFMRDPVPPLLIVTGIPLSLLLSMVLFHLLGISLNIISLSGLIMGVGMMVDNSIIVIDNITRLWRGGCRLDDACVEGTKAVTGPMFSSVLTTCAMFVPLIFMSGTAGALFYDQAMAITVTLFSSYFIAITQIPVFYRFIYRKQPYCRPVSAGKAMGWSVANEVSALHERVLVWLVRHRPAVWASLVVSVVASMFLYGKLEKQRLPDMSHSDALVEIEWNRGLTASQNDSCMAVIASAFPDLIEHYTSMSGVQQFVLSHTARTGQTGGILYVKAKDNGAMKRLEGLLTDFIHGRWPEAEFKFRSSGNIFDMLFADRQPPLELRVRLSGGMYDSHVIDGVIDNLRKVLPDAYIPPLEMNEYVELETQPEYMARYNVSYGQLLSYLQTAFSESNVMSLTYGGESIPLVTGHGQTDLSDIIHKSYLVSYGREIPLELLVKENRKSDVRTICQDRDGEYYPVAMQLKGAKIRETVRNIRENMGGDSKSSIDFTGSYYTGRKLVLELLGILAVSILLLYLILAAQFESLLQPLIVLSELTVDIFAALLALRLAGQSLNLMSMIGIVVMCGIVINDSILKIDTINRLRADGGNLFRPIFMAGRMRFKAIVMTSLTTVLAMLPLMVRGSMGSDLQYPLSLALVAGLSVGTLASIFFVPTAYYAIYRRK